MYFSRNLMLVLLMAFAISAASCKQEATCDDPNSDNYGEVGDCQYTFTLTSEAIDENGELKDEFKCETKTNGIENSIPLAWKNVPEGTGSLAIIMQHFPNPNDTLQANSYLLLWDIDPSVTSIPYGTADDGPWFMGSDKDGNYISYTSPCSPSVGTHTYEIILYALSETPSSLPSQSSLTVTWSVLRAAIATVTTIGTAKLEFDDVN